MQVDREGTFLADIFNFGLYEAESGAVGVNIEAKLVEIWDDGNKQWAAWSEYDMTAQGTIWIVKKDGTPNTKGAESLIRHAGWSGKCSDVIAGYWQPTRCQVVIKEDTYNDEKRYRIAFVNSADSTPGGGGNVSDSVAKALDAKYGSAFRALAGNAALNQPKQATKTDRPKPPPARSMDEAIARHDEANAAMAEAGDDIPY